MNMFWSSVVGALIAGYCLTVVLSLKKGHFARLSHGIVAAIATPLAYGMNWYSVQRFFVEANAHASIQEQNQAQGMAFVVSTTIVLGTMYLTYRALHGYFAKEMPGPRSV
jgi:prolipoprotein diacylglyceryltransferase